MKRILTVLILAGVCVTGQAQSRRTAVTVVSGELEHHLLTDDLFRIDYVWIRVAPGTEFHRWLSQGVHRDATIMVTTNAGRFADAKNARILRGTLMHETAPNASPVVHILFPKDELTGSLGAVTFQTTNLAAAMKFDSYDDYDVGIVIQIK